MQSTRIIVIAMLPVLSGLAGTASAQNNGRAPDPAVCADTANPPKDVLTQGGCVAIERAKGNCDACHAVPGAASSNIGPPLAGVSRQLSDSDLRARIQNPERFNPRTVMPPYGKHEILTPEEIDKLIAWLKTL